MAVITPDGIVGKVRDVFPHSAQVLAINDQTSGAGVILETTRIRGICVVAGNTDFPLGFLVVGFEILIGDRPVRERAAGYVAVSRAHTEIFFHVAPSHRAVTEGAAAHARGIVLITGTARAQIRSRPWLSMVTRGLRSSSGPKPFPNAEVRWLRRSSFRQSRAVYHFPRSSSTTLSRLPRVPWATMPPPAPAPTTTALTRLNAI